VFASRYEKERGITGCVERQKNMKRQAPLLVNLQNKKELV
jgi:hypothetical protein